ncbi:MAG: NADH-quinone oxidoreductase subunit NuoN [Betaproteobacteria bacterium]|nr:NADH-quinone oxidoreductase subunit NuoN [Betaproteobacteria bacterium]MCL2162285.1 NADH-quinone oxidoreductase subunit NuoN [Betaproteobacteria bacterium]
MNFEVSSLYSATAEIFVVIMILMIMLATAFARGIARGLAYSLAQFTLIVAAFITFFTLDEGRELAFNNMFVRDQPGGILKLMVYFSMMIALLYGRGYLAERKLDRPEYYLLALLTTLGMMVMITANHLLVLYVGLEMMSLSLYALVAFDRDTVRSTEAGMKYFVLGALASGLLLYGMSMIYGATNGSLELSAVKQAVFDDGANNTVLLFGLVFLVAGISFKLGVVPFHMWVPDVYQGSPTAVTTILSSAPKLAAFAMAMRLLAGGLPGLIEHWQTMLMFVAASSIILGNFAALAQRNIKRMLAYSGISHMGFMLLGLLAGSGAGFSSAMFYAIAYALMTLAAFGMVVLLSRDGFEAESIEDFKGLNRRNPWFALLMLFVMFSMAGIPFFVGFFAKFSVLEAVIRAGHLWIAVLAVAMSLIGAFYYLRVVKFMYFDEPADSTPLKASGELQVMLSLNGVAIALLGLMPGALLNWCQGAMNMAFAG